MSLKDSLSFHARKTLAVLLLGADQAVTDNEIVDNTRSLGSGVMLDAILETVENITPDFNKSTGNFKFVDIDGKMQSATDVAEEMRKLFVEYGLNLVDKNSEETGMLEMALQCIKASPSDIIDGSWFDKLLTQVAIVYDEYGNKSYESSYSYNLFFGSDQQARLELARAIHDISIINEEVRGGIISLPSDLTFEEAFVLLRGSSKDDSGDYVLLNDQSVYDDIEKAKELSGKANTYTDAVNQGFNPDTLQLSKVFSGEYDITAAQALRLNNLDLTTTNVTPTDSSFIAPYSQDAIDLFNVVYELSTTQNSFVNWIDLSFDHGLLYLSGKFGSLPYNTSSGTWQNEMSLDQALAVRNFETTYNSDTKQFSEIDGSELNDLLSLTNNRLVYTLKYTLENYAESNSGVDDLRNNVILDSNIFDSEIGNLSITEIYKLYDASSSAQISNSRIRSMLDLSGNAHESKFVDLDNVIRIYKRASGSSLDSYQLVNQVMADASNSVMKNHLTASYNNNNSDTVGQVYNLYKYLTTRPAASDNRTFYKSLLTYGNSQTDISQTDINNLFVSTLVEKAIVNNDNVWGSNSIDNSNVTFEEVFQGFVLAAGSQENLANVLINVNVHVADISNNVEAVNRIKLLRYYQGKNTFEFGENIDSWMKYTVYVDTSANDYDLLTRVEYQFLNTTTARTSVTNVNDVKGFITAVYALSAEETLSAQVRVWVTSSLDLCGNHYIVDKSSFEALHGEYPSVLILKDSLDDPVYIYDGTNSIFASSKNEMDLTNVQITMSRVMYYHNIDHNSNVVDTAHVLNTYVVGVLDYNVESLFDTLFYDYSTLLTGTLINNVVNETYDQDLSGAGLDKETRNAVIVLDKLLSVSDNTELGAKTIKQLLKYDISGGSDLQTFLHENTRYSNTRNIVLIYEVLKNLSEGYDKDTLWQPGNIKQILSYNNRLVNDTSYGNIEQTSVSKLDNNIYTEPSHKLLMYKASELLDNSVGVISPSTLVSGVKTMISAREDISNSDISGQLNRFINLYHNQWTGSNKGVTFDNSDLINAPVIIAMATMIENGIHVDFNLEDVKKVLSVDSDQRLDTAVDASTEDEELVNVHGGAGSIVLDNDSNPTPLDNVFTLLENLSVDNESKIRLFVASFDTFDVVDGSGNVTGRRVDTRNKLEYLENTYKQELFGLLDVNNNLLNDLSSNNVLRKVSDASFAEPTDTSLQLMTRLLHIKFGAPGLASNTDASMSAVAGYLRSILNVRNPSARSVDEAFTYGLSDLFEVLYKSYDHYATLDSTPNTVFEVDVRDQKYFTLLENTLTIGKKLYNENELTLPLSPTEGQTGEEYANGELTNILGTMIANSTTVSTDQAFQLYLLGNLDFTKVDDIIKAYRYGDRLSYNDLSNGKLVENSTWNVVLTDMSTNGVEDPVDRILQALSKVAWNKYTLVEDASYARVVSMLENHYIPYQNGFVNAGQISNKQEAQARIIIALVQEGNPSNTIQNKYDYEVMYLLDASHNYQLKSLSSHVSLHVSSNEWNEYIENKYSDESQVKTFISNVVNETDLTDEEKDLIRLKLWTVNEISIGEINSYETFNLLSTAYPQIMESLPDVLSGNAENIFVENTNARDFITVSDCSGLTPKENAIVYFTGYLLDDDRPQVHKVTHIDIMVNYWRDQPNISDEDITDIVDKLTNSGIQEWVQKIYHNAILHHDEDKIVFKHGSFEKKLELLNSMMNSVNARGNLNIAYSSVPTPSTLEDSYKEYLDMMTMVKMIRVIDNVDVGTLGNEVDGEFTIAEGKQQEYEHVKQILEVLYDTNKGISQLGVMFAISNLIKEGIDKVYTLNINEGHALWHIVSEVASESNGNLKLLDNLKNKFVQIIASSETSTTQQAFTSNVTYDAWYYIEPSAVGDAMFKEAERVIQEE